MKACRTIAVLGVFLVLATSSFGQDYLTSTGSPTFTTSVPADLGFVNAANGNLHLEIPLGTFPQRGKVPLTLSLVYDSKIWKVAREGSDYIWRPTNVPNSIGGWRIVTSVDVGSVTMNSTTSSCGEEPNAQYDTTHNTFTWTDPRGTRRVFPIATTQGGGCGGDLSSGDAFAQDSSGYRMYVTNYTQARVVAPDGTQVYPQFKDTNGNYFSSDASGNIIDTLGRTVFTKATTGNKIVYSILTSSGGRADYTITTTAIPVKPMFGQLGVSQPQTMLTVVQSLELPNHTKYEFTYDEAIYYSIDGSYGAGFGEVKSATLPTGLGAGWTYTIFADVYGFKNRWANVSPTVVSACSTPTSVGCSQKVVAGTPAGIVTYFFTVNNGAWNARAEFAEKTMRREFDFTQTCTNCNGAAYVRAVTEETDINAGAATLTRSVKYEYDSPQFGNIKSIKTWGYHTGSLPQDPDRETIITYLSAAPYVNSNILNRPINVLTLAGATKLSETKLTYDATSLDSTDGEGHSLATVVNHDPDYNASLAIRGNVTKVEKWVSGSTYIPTTYYYDTTGQLRKTEDALAKATMFTYADNFYSDNGQNPPAAFSPQGVTNAYLTKVSLATGDSISAGYYFGSGKKALASDLNQAVAYSHFADDLDRITSSQTASGWSLSEYPSGGEVLNYSGATGAASSGCVECVKSSLSVAYADGYLRIRQSLLNDPDGTIYQDTFVYGSTDNRTHATSNPYRSLTESTLGSTVYGYDTSYRINTVTNQDASIARTYYGPAVTSSIGRTTQLCATATYGLGYPVVSVDENGKKRQAWYNAFGSVIEVDEPDTTGLNLGTCYRYNGRGQLEAVMQGDRPRTFEYDGLGRTTKTITPESGEVKYGYTVRNSSLLCSGNAAAACWREDARSIVTTYFYEDPLNRITKVTYSDTTPTVKYKYEETYVLNTTLTNTKGRLSSQFTEDPSGTKLAGEAFSYDIAGRLVANPQCTRQNCLSGRFLFSYAIDPQQSKVVATNPFGTALTYSFNRVGQLTSVSSNVSNASHPPNLLYATKYNALGNRTEGTLGNGQAETYKFDNRGRLTQIRLGASLTGGAGTAAVPGTASLALSGDERMLSSTPATHGVATIYITGAPQFIPSPTQQGTASNASITIQGSERRYAEVAREESGSVGYFTVNGSEQTAQQAYQEATPGTGWTEISGWEQSAMVDTNCRWEYQGEWPYFEAWVCDQEEVYDYGTVSITVNGLTKSTWYGYGSTPSGLASTLASSFNADSASPVTASVSGARVSFQTKAVGSSTGYPLQAAGHSESGMFSDSFWTTQSGSTLTPGQGTAYNTIYDSGTLTVVVASTSKTVSYGAGSSKEGIANAFVTAFNQDAASPINASLSGSTVYLYSRAAGAATNYALGWNRTYAFSTGSYAIALSGSAMTGGADVEPAYTYDTGTVIISVNGQVKSGTYGRYDTPDTVAATLVAAINADGAYPVTASRTSNIISLTSKALAAAANYPLGFASSTNYPTLFGGTTGSFAASSPTGTMTGGADRPPYYDHGTITLQVSGVSRTVNWDGNSSSSSIATAFASAWNAANAGVTATANGSTLTLTTTATGSGAYYPISSSRTWDSPNFAQSAFGIQFATNPLMTPGQAATQTWDTGTVGLTVAGTTGTATYGQTSTRNSVLEALAISFNTQGGSQVLAAASGSTISFMSKQGGTATNYAISGVSSQSTAGSSTASFALSSASSLAGGTDNSPGPAGTKAIAVLAISGNLQYSVYWNYGFLGITIAGYQIEVGYSPVAGGTDSDTSSVLATRLAAAINQNPNVPVIATAVGPFVKLISKDGGSAQNIPFTATLRSAHPYAPYSQYFTGPAFTITASGPSLAGGEEPSSLYRVDLTYESSGHVKTATDTANGAWTYTYDELDRLKTATKASLAYDYNYDRWGNRTVQHHTVGSANDTTIAYTDKNRMVDFSYDLSGNLLNDGAHSYQYDAENRIVKVDGGATTYEYGPSGRRVRITTGGTIKDYLYYAGGSVAAVVDGVGNVVAEYVSVEGRLLATYKNGTYFSSFDHTGNLRLETDWVGNPERTCSGSPFGDMLSCAATSNHSFLFGTYARDGESNIDYAINRFYGSQYGRFVSPDPMGGTILDPQSLNAYAYVLNDPTSLADPEGLCVPYCNIGLVFNGTPTGYGGGYWTGGPFGGSPFGGGFGWGPASFLLGGWYSGGRVAATAGPSFGELLSKFGQLEEDRSWSLSWQIGASASYFADEVAGVWDVTGGAVYQIGRHPIDTLTGLARVAMAVQNPFADESMEVFAGLANGAQAWGDKLAAGDPRAVGQLVGTVASFAEVAGNVRYFKYPSGGEGLNILNTPTRGSRLALETGAWKGGSGLHFDIYIKRIPGNWRVWQRSSGPGSNWFKLEHWQPWL